MDIKKELNEYRILIKNPGKRFKRELLLVIFRGLTTIPLLSIIFIFFLDISNNYEFKKGLAVLAIAFIFTMFRGRLENFIVRDELSKKIQVIKNEYIYKGNISELFDTSCVLTNHVLKTRKDFLEKEFLKNNGIDYICILKLIDEIEYLKEIVSNDKKIRAIQDFKDIKSNKLSRSDLISDRDQRARLVIDTLGITDDRDLGLQKCNFLIYMTVASLSSSISFVIAYYLISVLFFGYDYQNLTTMLTVISSLLVAIPIVSLCMHFYKSKNPNKIDYSKSLYDIFDIKNGDSVGILAESIKDKKLLNYYLFEEKYEDKKINLINGNIKFKSS